MEQGSTSEGARQAAADILSQEWALLQMAEAVLQLRRERKALFEPSLFGEPAWDMLLSLYAREGRGQSTTVMQLQEASTVPPSTADRWLRQLENIGLVSRRSHSALPETDFLELADRAKQSLDTYLGRVLKQQIGMIRRASEDPTHAAR